MRLKGHTLEHEGAPHDDTGKRVCIDWCSVTGQGRAKCSCGKMSEHLKSAAARKRWHRQHKKEASKA